MKNLLSMKKNFVKSTIFSDFSSKNVNFTKSFQKKGESKFTKFDTEVICRIFFFQWEQIFHFSPLCEE